MSKLMLCVGSYYSDIETIGENDVENKGTTIPYVEIERGMDEQLGKLSFYSFDEK
jgi:hypothetical protein